MAKEQVAGAIILGKLRERIIAGLYLGYWRAGERLPSIREIAEAEQVDRKTAAAAYRRLQEEGLVRVRPRSGVYLCAPTLPEPPGPLERLYRQWLEHTYEGARDLGLDTQTILRLVTTIAEIEQAPLPVVECNWTQAEAIAGELRRQLEVNAAPYLLEELRPGDPMLTEAAVVVTTPYHGAELALLVPGRVIVEATMAPDVLRDLRQRLTRGSVAIVVENASLANKLGRALRHCQLDGPGDRLQIITATDRGDVLGSIGRTHTVYIWPGTPTWVDDILPPSTERVRPSRTLSDESLDRVQAAILDAAIRRIKAPTRAKRPQEVRAL